MPNVLTQKNYKQYEKLSRYTVIPTYYHTIDGRYVYGTARNLKLDVPYELYKTKKGDTPDKIALSYYNTPTFYWIILDFNRIQDPYIVFEEGIELKIPQVSSLDFV